MPTFEFYGYDAATTDTLIGKIREHIGHLPYCRDIVFVEHAHDGSRVVAWDGEEKPFVRILTRSPEKADELRRAIETLSDVETAIIGYYPRI